MRIRPASERDLPAIAAIYNHEVAHGVATFDTEPWDRESTARWFAAHDPSRRPVLVAVAGDGTVVGWASLSDWSTRCAYLRAAENSVYVHAEHRGRGVGRMLLEAVLDRAPGSGVKVVLARIETSGVASRALHIACGFVSVGVMHRVGEKFGRVLDVELFERSLES